jgi:hypothetical protein
LVVDNYFVEICAESKAHEIEFFEDGNWKEYQEKKEKQAQKDRKPRTEASKSKNTAVVIHGRKFNQIKLIYLFEHPKRKLLVL